MEKVKGTLEKKSTKKADKYYDKDELRRTLIMGILGLILVIMPSEFNKLIGTLIGLALLFVGLSSLYSYLESKAGFTPILVSAILYSLLGLVVLIFPGSVMQSIAILVGIILLITGLSKVRLAFTLKDINSDYIGTLIIGILITLLGISLIFNPFSGDVITKYVGAFLVIVAIFDLIDNYIFQK